MDFALTTRWNASRHASGEDMIEEILGLGFTHVELGYDLRMDHVPGVENMIRRGAVRVDSVHNYCPVPVGAPAGHPELFTLASLDRRTRESAVEHTSRTIRFAAGIGASIVIIHAGNVKMKRMSDRLRVLCERGKQFTPEYEKAKLKLQVARDKKAVVHLEHLYKGIERLLPVLAETNVRLAIENLPSWESVPSEVEIETMLAYFDSDHLAYWHDIGHAQIRENLGLINQERWLERLQGRLAGFHIHDVQPPVYDHVMPPDGNIDFARLKRFARLPVARVIEPTPATPREAIEAALVHVRKAWADD